MRRVGDILATNIVGGGGRRARLVGGARHRVAGLKSKTPRIEHVIVKIFGGGQLIDVAALGGRASRLHEAK